MKASRIMVMDDEDMVLDVVCSQLLSLGHEAALVKDGQEAMDKYQEFQDAGHPIDLAILDLTIAGGIGGEETSENLLKLDPQAKLIVSSGYSNDPVIADYRSFGFQASLVKPFDLEEFKKALSSVL